LDLQITLDPHQVISVAIIVIVTVILVVTILVTNVIRQTTTILATIMEVSTATLALVDPIVASILVANALIPIGNVQFYGMVLNHIFEEINKSLFSQNFHFSQNSDFFHKIHTFLNIKFK